MKSLLTKFLSLIGLGSKKHVGVFGSSSSGKRTISVPLSDFIKDKTPTLRTSFVLGGQRKTPFTRCELYGKKKGHSRGRKKNRFANGIH